MIRAVEASSGLSSRRGTGYRGGVIGLGSFDPANEPTIITWWSADNADNVTETVSETFDPSDVDTTNDKIALSITGFTRVSPYRFGVFYFSTTGTLPAPFVAATPYIGVNNGDGTFSFYPYNSDADYADFPDYDDGETIFPGHSYGLQRNKIDITTQGTGTHTITTDELLLQLYNKVDGTALLSAANRDNAFRILTDANGPYIYQDGTTGFSSDFIEPSGKFNQDTLSAAAVGAMFENKRFMYSVAVIEPLHNTYFSKGRAILTTVNTGTGVFTSANHNIQTAEEAFYGAMSDNGVFPTPTVAFAANIYARRIDANTFTLHPTATDATNNTNKYVYSDTGTGIYYVSGGKAIKSASSKRRMLFDLSMQSNDHAFAPSCFDYTRSIPLDSSSFFLAAGFGNGNINFVALPADIGSAGWTVQRVYLYIPSGFAGPTCLDTGTALLTGTYWITRETGATGWIRLHRTEADALASVGIATNSLTNDDVIKYGALGTGNGAFQLLDGFLYQPFDDGLSKTNLSGYNAYGTYGVYVQVIDYDDDVTGKRIYWSGVNSKDSVIDGLAGSLNSPQPAKSASSALTLSNTGQPHVPGHYKMREVFTGGGNSDPTTIVNNLIAWAADKYGITI